MSQHLVLTPTPPTRYDIAPFMPHDSTSTAYHMENSVPCSDILAGAGHRCGEEPDEDGHHNLRNHP